MLENWKAAARQLVSEEFAEKLFPVGSAFQQGQLIKMPACFESDILPHGIPGMSSSREENLHIGCGRRILEGFTNVDDLLSAGVDYKVDLEKRLLFADNRFQCVFSYMVLEHIRNLLALGEELWRVSKHGAVHYHHIPWWTSYRTWGDPTHVRAFAEQSWAFWNQDCYRKNAEAGSPMGQYGPKLDFSIDLAVLVLHEEFRGRPTDEVSFAVRHYNNVVSQHFVVMRAIKNREVGEDGDGSKGTEGESLGSPAPGAAPEDGGGAPTAGAAGV